jgi:flagellar transcriptional activator FlhD
LLAICKVFSYKLCRLISDNRNSFPVMFSLTGRIDNVITVKAAGAGTLVRVGRGAQEGGPTRSFPMKSTDTYNDIKEVNLAYMMLAQNMVRSDREAAIFRLGISEEIADILERLTPGQVLKMASSEMLLCSFRFEDSLLIDLLANHERDRGVGHIHAAILAAGRPVETVA